MGGQSSHTLPTCLQRRATREQLRQDDDDWSDVLPMDILSSNDRFLEKLPIIRWNQSSCLPSAFCNKKLYNIYHHWQLARCTTIIYNNHYNKDSSTFFTSSASAVWLGSWVLWQRCKPSFHFVSYPQRTFRGWSWTFTTEILYTFNSHWTNATSWAILDRKCIACWPAALFHHSQKTYLPVQKPSGHSCLTARPDKSGFSPLECENWLLDEDVESFWNLITHNTWNLEDQQF